SRDPDRHQGRLEHGGATPGCKPGSRTAAALKTERNSYTAGRVYVGRLELYQEFAMTLRAAGAMIFALSITLSAQQPASDEAGGWRRAESAPPENAYTVASGTKVPLSLINSISTKHSAEGDRVYLETVFPILDKGRIVIPPGSYVAGTVT